jgi:aryl-alcohol dehydrogenase-like predicted oxidoreductase
VGKLPVAGCELPNANPRPKPIAPIFSLLREKKTFWRNRYGKQKTPFKLDRGGCYSTLLLQNRYAKQTSTPGKQLYHHTLFYIIMIIKYNQLGNSDLMVSEIGFGCMSLGDNHHDNSTLLNKAFDLGINYFDTADLYQKGFNEETVGKAFKGKRDQVLIATKVGNQWRDDGSGWDWNPNKDYILKSVEESLRRLQTDHIDLYQLHGGTIEDPIDDVIDTFEQLQLSGKIRYYGISSIRPNVIREYVKRSKIVSVMMQYSLLDRRPEESCLNLLLENNIGVLSRGGLASGLLVNKPAKNYLNYGQGDVKIMADAVAQISDGQRIPAQTALRFVLAHPAITSAVVGIRTEKQLEEAVETVKTTRLSDDEMLLLKETLPANIYEQHR